MLKYVDEKVTFSEFPREVALCISLSGCPNKCEGCHSSYLWEDIGIPLTEEILAELIGKNKGITCIGFMGGDQEPEYIDRLAYFVKKKYDNLKVGWYSGKPYIDERINTDNFDFIKIGPYVKEKGPLTATTTNQVFYSKGEHLNKMSAYKDLFYDVTNWFWRNDTNS